MKKKWADVQLQLNVSSDLWFIKKNEQFSRYKNFDFKNCEIQKEILIKS